MNASRASVSAWVMVGLLAGTVGAVTMETVLVGNPGNAPDTEVMLDETTGYGAVGYAYNIGKYEVTAGQYTEFLNAVAKTDTYSLYSPNTDTANNPRGCNIKRTGSPGSYSYSVASDWANRPVNWVSWGDSARFVNWLHNGQPTGTQNASTTEDGSYALNGAMSNAALAAVTRNANATWVIPSEDEWYKAAYHKNDGVTANYFNYPTSSDNRPSNVLGDPIDPGNNATYHNINYTIDSPYWRTEVGAHENSDSPYGTFDQAGNVWEWNEAVVYGLSRGLRGGSFTCFTDNDLHAATRINIYPADEDNDLGFRVSQVPSPGTLSLLGLGGFFLHRRRSV